MMDPLLSHTKTAPSESAAMGPPQQNSARRRKNHRAGKKKKKSSRRKSFVIPSEDTDHDIGQDTLRPHGLEQIREDFYQGHGRNPSISSLDSEALLDHREQQPYMRARRPSILHQGSSFRQEQQTPSRLRTVQRQDSHPEDEDEGQNDPWSQNDTWNENAPLLSSSGRMKSDPLMSSGGYGSNNGRLSSPSSNKGKHLNAFANNARYDVNYPPSVPGSPSLRATDRDHISFGDMMMRDNEELDLDRSRSGSPQEEDNLSQDGDRQRFSTSPLERRNTIAFQAEEDVCFPQDGMSELGEESRDPSGFRMRARRRRRRWPDLSILNEWSRYEKEGRSEERRVKKITEPALINGRLRPVHKGWYRTEEDAPYRFTYFNEEFQSTIHSQTISELVQPGGTFRELFIPDPPILSDSEDSSDEEDEHEHNESTAAALHEVLSGQKGEKVSLSTAMRRASSQTRAEAKKDVTSSPGADKQMPSAPEGKSSSTDQTPVDQRSPERVKSPQPATLPAFQPTSQPTTQPPSQQASQSALKEEKSPRYGERPVWWLDVLSPTEAEMKVLSKAFAIHPLTAEDIMVQEQREKVELFRHYYFVNYRTFDQDPNSETFLEPVNMYVVVFREGVLSFHFSMTPHPANVRRRIRQLRDYMILSSDWISYAIIDDITDVFFPLIQNIEDEVDNIDDAILRLHSGEPDVKDAEKNEEKGGDMLRRVGDCRKKVMGLYRLLGNKADVIKGFAKRCNEHWEVAPRSEIGLYLGDIQDHIVTMTANLSHYEKYVFTP